MINHTQVLLACELGKPLFLHERDAHPEMVSILERLVAILMVMIVSMKVMVMMVILTMMNPMFILGRTIFLKGWS